LPHGQRNKTQRSADLHILETVINDHGDRAELADLIRLLLDRLGVRATFSLHP
jgi:hypothetical protein